MNAHNKIIQLLEEKNIAYEQYNHEPVRTSEEAENLRKSLDIHIDTGIKALLVNVESKLFIKKQSIMLAIPGEERFNSSKVKTFLQASKINFINEEEVVQITDGVLPGGVPPFGNIFGIQMIADPKILSFSRIGFNAGDKSITIVMNALDWRKITNPIIYEII